MALGRAARIGVVILVACGVVIAGSVLVSQLLVKQPLVDGCTANVAGGTTRLTVEEAENAALISALSVQRGLPARAATIALATAYQESGLHNISYGHLDSVGLFQQRPSQGWGTEQQILDPYYATASFYTALAKIHGYSAMDIAAAAQLVQRSADGGAYSQHEASARALASSLTGQSEAAFSCELRETSTTGDPTALRRELARAFGTARFTSAGFGGSSGVQPAIASSRSAGGKVVVDIPVRPADRTFGWSVAQWSVAYAQRFGIESISYGGHSWSAGHSVDGWRADDAASARRIRMVLTSSG
ncbi:MAG TPA: hypothetical protein VE287_10150 [Actinopolymorphaceae bacterium]|nr:hypothetical protein [Actinopolymorphaceae bacterium]